MPDISKHPILQQISDLIYAIEACGASPELTRAVCLAERLYTPAEALIDASQPQSLPVALGSTAETSLPPMSDDEIELEIRSAGADVAPRIAAGKIDALHASLVVRSHHFPGTTTTVAVAALPDGFVVATGHSACISAANFKRDIGEQIAADNARAAARSKLWELEGYLLRDSLRADAEFIGGSMTITD
ncbi:Gp49 family protein [Paracidovorax valerianellae]|uniref:Phage protein (N4 Gp49/phage Sf6 gene 66) family protein n=1 Tax=Paracidovorax valerianellae TaxID=187868 RepID=A0A1G7EIU5_9BURK|nr:Gp49 family protein [Paracidovorax valerianellae]MDA8446375.1 Gp49 family protein [Paracidovorax valerianellae]SDE63590.1 Phage protein (N4 Gp49/phage Sf6 gene 66) family protein [Paracidovorax valerianellae]